MLNCASPQNPNWVKMVETVGKETATNIYTNLESIPELGVAPNGNPSLLYADLVKAVPERAAELWYSTKTIEFSTKRDIQTDSNNEPILSEVLEQGIKFAGYTSSTDERINTVITSADKYIKETYIRFGIRTKAFPNSGQLKTAVDNLKELGIERDIVDLDLSNLASALTMVLKYQREALLGKSDSIKTAGILERLGEYENTPITDILSSPRSRKDFIDFMKYSLRFLKGYSNIDTLSSLDSDTYTQEEKVINDLVVEIQQLSISVNNALNKLNNLLDLYYETELLKYTTNPEIKDGLRRILDPGDDESYTQYLLDAMADTNNPFIGTMVKKIMITEAKAQEEWRTEIGYFESLFKRVTGKDIKSATEYDFDKYLDKVNGVRTGKLVQQYDWNKFYADKRAYMEDVRKKYNKNSPAYIKAIKRWYTENEVYTLTEADVEAIIKRKREELSTYQYNQWARRNLVRDEDGYTVKLGDAGFKTPTDKYLNPDWLRVKDDELYNYIRNTLAKYADFFGRQNILLKGFIPNMTEQERSNLQIVKDPVGWYNAHAALKKTDTFVGETGETEYILKIPMMEFFSQEEPIKYRTKRSDEDFKNWEQDVLQDVAEAGRGAFKSIKEISEKNREIQAANEAYHAGKINYNLGLVLPSFIREATRYRHKQSLKNEVDLSVHKLRNLQLTKRTPKGTIAKDAVGSKLMNKTMYQMVPGAGTNLEKHYMEWLEAVFYGNFDIDEGEWTKISKILLKYTSAKNMWLNVTAGIANVAFGKVQMKMERAAGWYFEASDMRKADLQYIGAIPDMIVNLSSTSASNLTTAIIKMLDVSQNTNEKDFTSGMMHNQLMSSSSLYFINDMGEHYMQNVGLLAMMRHHRIIDGKIVSATEHRMMNYKQALNDILDETERTRLKAYLEAAYEQEQFKDKKKDYLRDFILQLPVEKGNAFVARKAELDATSNKDFKSYPRLIDAFELDDNGLAQIRKEIEVDGKTIDVTLNENEYEAFRLKAIHVNQKIHGIYNTEDASTASRRAMGKMIIQFKKWARPGWNKRFGTKFGKSFWNESRAEWDKGSYTSMYHFLKSPFKRRITEEGEVEQFHKMMSRVLGDLLTFNANIGLYWNTLDDADKANVRRVAVDMSYLALTMVVAALLSKFDPDDDEPDFAYDLLVYEVDRIMSELMVFNPTGIGLINESKKFMNSPAAVQGTLISIGSLMAGLIGYPFKSEEKRRYQTGVYKDELKIKVHAMKSVPILNKYQQLQRINKFNKYYILFRG